MRALRSATAGICLGLLLAGSAVASAAVDCPQPRFTGKAPDEYYRRANPLQETPDVLAAGEAVYTGEPRKVSCATCHGVIGDGKGKLSDQFDPPPRNFACADTIRGVPDGQLFWIIRYGSPDTSMPPHKKLSDEQIWQVVHYIRGLSK